MSSEPVFIYEPYFGYDDDADEIAAAKLRRLVELLDASAANTRGSRELAVSVLRNAKSYEALRPETEAARPTVVALLDELLPGYADLAYTDGGGAEPTKRQGRIALYQPPSDVSPLGDAGVIDETKRQG